MEVDPKKFDAALHDNLQAIKKFDRYVKEVIGATIIMQKAIKNLEKCVVTDWQLHRQNMLSSLETNDDFIKHRATEGIST